MLDNRLLHLDDMFQPSWNAEDMVFLTDNVAQLATFRFKRSPNHVFIVTNCHLYWRPTHNYVKLLQVLYLLQQASVYQQEQSSGVSDTPIVACGGRLFR
jgi:mRNA deadenylase 3'-5' endonuclease subunit Ccr4